MANLSTARSPKPAAQRERGWNILNRRSRNLDPLSRHGRNGEGETISLRSVREALQESEWAEIPPAACTSLQPGIKAEPAESGRRAKQPTRHECQCSWSRHGGHGYWDVLICARDVSWLIFTCIPIILLFGPLAARLMAYSVSCGVLYSFRRRCFHPRGVVCVISWNGVLDGKHWASLLASHPGLGASYRTLESPILVTGAVQISPIPSVYMHWQTRWL